MPPTKGGGIRNPNKARLGIVCSTPATASTGRARRRFRVSRIPTGTPMATATAVESSTRIRCWTTRAASSARRSARKLSTRGPPCARWWWSRQGGGEEVGDEAGVRLLPDLLRRALLHHAPGMHHRDAVAESQRFRHVVGDEDDRFAQAALQGLELVLQPAACQGVEGAEGLVHEQEGRIRAKGPRQTRALALAARERARPR